MTMRSPVQPPAMLAERRRLQQSERSQQIDLFDGVTPTQTPAWRDLPEETRGTLTGLMARLILEHAQISSPALRPPQRIRARPSTPALSCLPATRRRAEGSLFEALLLGRHVGFLLRRGSCDLRKRGRDDQEPGQSCPHAALEAALHRQPDRFGPDQTTRAVLTAVGRG
jgi:hypothetical protein